MANDEFVLFDGQTSIGRGSVGYSNISDALSASGLRVKPVLLWRVSLSSMKMRVAQLLQSRITGTQVCGLKNRSHSRVFFEGLCEIVQEVKSEHT